MPTQLPPLLRAETLGQPGGPAAYDALEALTPATIGAASVADVQARATAAQGQLADTAVQPEQLASRASFEAAFFALPAGGGASASRTGDTIEFGAGTSAARDGDTITY